MKGWREAVAAKSERQGTRDNRDNRDNRGANVPNVPNVPPSPSLSLHHWHAEFTKLDDFTPPANMPLDDWLTLIDDSIWLYENFAREAVSLGWTGADLFGLRNGQRGNGGLADHLNGARHLYFSGKLATWSKHGVRSYLTAPNDPALVPMWAAV